MRIAETPCLTKISRSSSSPIAVSIWLILSQLAIWLCGAQLKSSGRSTSSQHLLLSPTTIGSFRTDSRNTAAPIWTSSSRQPKTQCPVLAVLGEYLSTMLAACWKVAKQPWLRPRRIPSSPRTSPHNRGEDQEHRASYPQHGPTRLAAHLAFLSSQRTTK